MFRRIFRTSDEDYKKKLQGMRQTVEGAEILDPTPMEPPLGYIKQPSMVEHIRALIRSEKLRQEAEAAGDESFEESDDFDVEDEIEPISQYEFERYFEPHPPVNDPPGEVSIDKPLDPPSEDRPPVAKPTVPETKSKST